MSYTLFLVKNLMPYICCLRYTSIHLLSSTTVIFTFFFMDTLIFFLSGCSTAKTENISYSELRRATNNFHQSNKIGRGGFGIVYKVQLYSKYFSSFICLSFIAWTTSICMRLTWCYSQNYVAKTFRCLSAVLQNFVFQTCYYLRCD